MPKPFAVLDVDGTIFKSSLVEKAVDHCVSEGLFAAEPFNEVFANRRRWQADNEEGTYNAYLHKLVGAFVGQMADVEVERFDQVIATMVDEHQVRRFAFPRRLIRALNTTHHVVAISGSPDILVTPFLEDLEVDAVFGSTYEQQDGRFTGAAESVGDKAAIIRRLVRSGVAIQTGSVAVGDTMGDSSILHAAAFPIMFNPSRTLTSYGREFGWTRVMEVKDQITALQYSAEQGVYAEVNPEDIPLAIQMQGPSLQ